MKTGVSIPKSTDDIGTLANVHGYCEGLSDDDHDVGGAHT